MSRVHLLSASEPGDRYWDERAHWDLDAMRELASSDRFKEHALVEDPGDADLVLFVETSTCAGPYFESVRRHPIYREYRPTSYVYCATDVIVPLVPGVFPSIARRDYLDGWSRAGGYLARGEREKLAFDPDRRPSILFSFVGSSVNHPVRRRIMGLAGRDGLLVDTAGGRHEPGDENRYRDALLDSSFVLCPRGGGPASFRLMETMMMGRAPVIISDQWCAPTGPRWEEFSLRVEEAKVDAIPELLEANRARAEEMGRKAREAWLDWFGPETQFHRTVGWLDELQRLSPTREDAGRIPPWLKAARPYHALRWARHRFSRRG